jgi:predicted  nucleic acid-binding Zn-ribbon protein
MTQFVCENCRYIFASEKAMIRSCPYCGKLGTVKKEATAENLINEVDRMVKDGRL